MIVFVNHHGLRVGPKTSLLSVFTYSNAVNLPIELVIGVKRVVCQWPEWDKNNVPVGKWTTKGK